MKARHKMWALRDRLRKAGEDLILAAGEADAAAVRSHNEEYELECRCEKWWLLSLLGWLLFCCAAAGWAVQYSKACVHPHIQKAVVQ